MSQRQQLLISITLSKVLFFPFLLKFIIKNNSIFSIISLILGFILGLLIILIFNKKDYKKNNLLFKIYYLLSSFLLLFISIFYLTKQTNTFYLKETSFIFIVVLFILLIIYGASKKLNTLSRLNEILTPLSIVLVIISIIGNIKNINIFFFIENTTNINYNTLYSSILIGVFTSFPIILLFYIYNEYNIKQIYKGYIISFIIMLLMLLSTIFTLGINLANYFEFPFYIALKKIQLFSFIERIENIIIIFSYIDITIFSIFLLLVIKKLLFNNIK